MQDAKELSMQDKENLAGEVMESLGEPSKEEDGLRNSSSSQHTDSDKDDLPLVAKERLGRQEKRHKKEIRALQEQMQQLHASINSNNNYSHHDSNQSIDPYAMGNTHGELNEHVYKAVNYALAKRDEEERKAKDAEQMAHVHQQYRNLFDKLDNDSDKYDDFDEVVKGDESKFTPAMRDALLLLPHGNAADVAYKIAKNKQEFQRITSLHPLDQARELIKLSVALKGGNDQASSAHKPLGQIKNNPVSTHGINESTSIGDLRRKMRAGWK